MSALAVTEESFVPEFLTVPTLPGPGTQEMVMNFAAFDWGRVRVTWTSSGKVTIGISSNEGFEGVDAFGPEEHLSPESRVQMAQLLEPKQVDLEYGETLDVETEPGSFFVHGTEEVPAVFEISSFEFIRIAIPITILPARSGQLRIVVLNLFLEMKYESFEAERITHFSASFTRPVARVDKIYSGIHGTPELRAVAFIPDNNLTPGYPMGSMNLGVVAFIAQAGALDIATVVFTGADTFETNILALQLTWTFLLVEYQRSGLSQWALFAVTQEKDPETSLSARSCCKTTNISLHC
jgi:hypothetical protein